MRTQIIVFFSIFLVFSCASAQSKKKVQAPKDDFFVDDPSPPITTTSKETGFASWYGGEFQGRPTASGDPYDMYGYTAAHKTLPLGSVVVVTNLENQKKVVLRINDRGPFVEGRIIDVTKAAAEELGFAEQGTTKVQIEVIKENAPYEISATEQQKMQVPASNFAEDRKEVEMPDLKEEELQAIVKSNGNYQFVDGKYPQGYTVQVGAFVVPDNATKYKEKIEQDFHKEAFIAKRDKWNFVWVGDFSTTQEARDFLQELKRLGIDVMYRGKVE